MNSNRRRSPQRTAKAYLKGAATAKKSKPSKAKPAPPRASKSTAEAATTAENSHSISAPAPSEETKSQQRLLDIFSSTFAPVLSAPDFAAVLRKVKQALFERDFDAAFGSAQQQHLEVYAARWSPPRALCYGQILRRIADEFLEPLLLLQLTTTTDYGRAVSVEEVEVDDEVELGRVSPTLDDLAEQEEEDAGRDGGGITLRMLAIGGGAAEIVAFAEYLRSAGAAVSGDLTLLDTGSWGQVVQKLQAGLTTPPPVSKYASAAAKATSAALIEPTGRLRSTFVQQDVLQLDGPGLSSLLGQTPLLVTLLFTLNELYTSGGIKMTTAFLRNLSAAIPAGSLLLVVDSPGSYSEAAVGKEAKKYPMQWLLDHTLLQADKLPAEGCRWEKIQSHDSVWFRLSEKLRYPIDLQDMRYQMHLYRAMSRSSD
ncbi:hypothetical protein F5Y00DRAFT_68909 [Daldinia vernicosa]|uniref:uncharacterized protein n=1 Tax=Daldinia vernicosa TaxID=114800 RepID=UPI002008A99D|nr:uncharacterized protein F5Y00DRAFT_68909 [Daldinia vernicosa]KAI0849225.1 hypothetical protein F5Y00DRAFT_68909 [Daldinia vernicosa]